MAESVLDLERLGGNIPPIPDDYERRIPDYPIVFLTEEEIQELATRLALSGSSMDEGLKVLENVRRFKLDTLEEDFRVRRELLDKWIAELEKHIEQHKQKLDELKEKSTSLHQLKFNIETGIQLLQLKKTTVLLGMHLKKIEREKQFFVDEEKKLKEKKQDIQKEILDWKQKELDDAKKIHEQLLEMWEIDEEELRRRAGIFEDEKGNIERLLENVDEKVRDLREVGITRTVAGFLIWVGYTAFAGVGSVIGGLLQKRQENPKGADIIGNFIQAFAAFFGFSQGDNSIWLPFIKLIGFTLLVLILIVGVATLSDKILKAFDSRWEKVSNKKGKRKEKGNKSRWQEILSLFSTGADRLSLFSNEITRGDYVQLLAASPYILLAVIVIFLISALGLTGAFGGSGQNEPVPATLTTASIGAVFILLSTSVCLLYATKIIEPRWNRYIKEDQSKIGFWKYLKINWEFALIAFSMVIALLMVTFLPIGGLYDYRAWGLVALFMTFGSLGLAYGLIFRGIFKDFDYLTRRRQEYLAKTQEFILKPTLGDVYENSEPEEMKESLNKYRKATDYLDGLRIGTEMNRIAMNSPDDQSGFLRFWFEDFEEFNPTEDSLLSFPQRSAKRLRRLIRRLAKQQPVAGERELLTWDISPEDKAAYEGHEEQIKKDTAQIQEIVEELSQIDSEKNTTNVKLSSQENEMKDCEIRREIAHNNLNRKRKEYDIQKERDVTKFMSAFLVGKILYEYLAEKSA